MLVVRPALRFKRLTVTPIASRVAAVTAGEEYELIGPLMESLDADLGRSTTESPSSRR